MDIQKGDENMLITSDYAKAIRRKQADMQLTAKQASEQIGVNHITYRKLRSGGEVRTKTFEKAMAWLVKDY